MLIYLKLHQSKVLLVLLGITLFFWALVVSIKLISTKNQTVLIRVDDFQTQVINEESVENIPIQLENFIGHFIGYFYSYTSHNFDKHIDKAIQIMDQQLARSFVQKLNAMSEKTKTKSIFQSAYPLQITQLKEFDFEIKMRVYHIENDIETEDDFLIRLKIKKIQRTLENPFGLEVVEINENYS